MSKHIATHRPKSAGFFAIGYLVYLIFGLIELLLAFRFLLALLDANRANAFVAFIFNASAPLVAPFQGIFGLDVYSTARFEWATLIALIVFAIIGGLLASLLRQPAPRE